MEEYRKFVDFPTEKIVDEFKAPWEVCSRVGLRWKVVGDMTGGFVAQR